MLKVRQVKVNVEIDNEESRLAALLKKLRLNKKDIISYDITKQSLDARDKNQIFYVYEFEVIINNEKDYLKRNNKGGKI